ncbi:hypothetical protein IQ250_06510 [Pseudanabaenaceae cyanobacterium LEGE 13415]|nr:hypothetical protein [Pseudanabaenaceae cyanobacterium LEGE 13415]
MKTARTSTALEKATARLRALRAINPTLDFGNDRSVLNFDTLANKLEYRLEKHNQLLTDLETSKNELKELEKQVNELSSQMLKGVEFMYGHDSDEYELVGGVKMSDRVRKSRITRLKSSSDTQAANIAKAG